MSHGGGGHSSFGGGGHAMSRTGGGHSSFGGGGHAMARTGAGHSSFSGAARTRGGGNHSFASHNRGSFNHNGSFNHSGNVNVHSNTFVHNGGGHRGFGGGGRFHPTGIGHNTAWFNSHGGWHHGPGYIHPIYGGIYIGYSWGVIPPHRELVWIQDPATGEYYEAYYYPDYGYYAWYNRPLVAVGVYNPSLAITVRL
jgi:hypothetical protein